jgi:chitinase
MRKATAALGLGLTAVLAATAPLLAARRPVIIGYVFAQDELLDPASIAAEKLTHVNYAFANVQDGRVVEGFRRDAENFAVLRGLKARNPDLKILVSVGGWTWSGGFSDAALTPESRTRFVESAVDFVRRHELDGFDVDWEYPGQLGYGNVNRPEDKENFTALMAALRRALDRVKRPKGRKLLLTFAAGANTRFLENTQMARVQEHVDYVNLMTYDFAGDWDPQTGHHANLFPHPRDPKQRSADRAVREFAASGVPLRKLVLGVPFYGRAWSNVEPEADGLYQTGTKPSERLDTNYPSLAALGGQGGWLRRWDETAQAPFLWNAGRRLFVSYDDPESLRIKARYVKTNGLAGVMFWQHGSDPSGALLDALYGELARP